VIETTFLLDPDELEAITAEYGKGVLKSPEITVSRGYARNETGSLTLWVSVPVNEAALVTHLVESYGLPDAIRNEALQQPSLVALSQFLLTKSRRDAEAVAAKQTEANQLEDEVAKAAAMEEARTLAESQQAQSLRARLASLQRHPDIGIHIWQTILQPHFPTFLYFDEYYQLRGHDNVGALMQRKAANILERSDHPLLGLIELARLDLDKLLSPTRTQELKNKLQGASNHLSRQILKHWSQNKHLQILFDVRPALAG
jgi:hypothetical protein